MTIQQLSKLDGRMAARDDVKTAIIYAMRNWQAYYMLPGHSRSHNHQYLEKAYLGAMAAHRRNEPSAWLFSLAIFMAIESRHLDTATNMLDAAMSYRSFLKTNEPFYYNVFRFLEAYLAITENRARAAKKHRKGFLSQLKTAEYSPYYDVMIGQLHLAAAEHTQAYSYFAQAHSYGCHSMYMYDGLYRSLDAADPSEIGEELLPTLVYAARHGADISRVTTTHEGAVFDAILKAPHVGEQLYALSNHTPLLNPICANRMHNRDFGLPAHEIYSQAIKHQIDIKGLSTFLVQSSYINHIENIDTYPLERFLNNAKMEPQLAAYIYHLILTDPAHHHLMHGHEENALQVATKCLQAGITGREANSLYQYFWESTKAKGELAQKAEAELATGLTQFEIEIAKTIKYVYVSLQEKRGTHEYVVAESTPSEAQSHRIIIDAPHENFTYVCLGAGRRTVITEPPTIKRMVPLATPELYQYFFDKGDRRLHILLHLTSHYLEIEPPSAKAIPIFEAVLEEKSLQKAYTMKVLAALGHLHHLAGNHAKAHECYTLLDMTTLPPTYLDQALNVCLQTKEYTLATEILSQNHKSLPAQVVYDSLHQLHQDAPDAAKHLGEAAFYLLLSGHSSKILLTTALTHYHASQSELKTLSNALEVPDSRVDAKILSGDLWAHQCDIHTQKAFRRLITAKKAQKECMQFIEYCTYTMLTQSLAPEYEVINILEKHYLANSEIPHNPEYNSIGASGCPSSNNLLLLALGHIYLHNNISTFRSEKLLRQAISMQEVTGILLPIFKENKPIPHPYLEKYQPFLYHSQPDKDIRLNYRVDDTRDFYSTPMQYLAYGLYIAKLPLFYNETVTYYFSDEMPTGSITTHQASHKNTTPFLYNHPQDSFFAINNAIIHEHMFRHQEMEDIIGELVKAPVTVQGQLL
ncbi:MAG: DUF5717 family protein [Defluviitaleaceae bacterium]|nr:DUF5717 family protein [Defluviitaleaceae bacterium]